MKKIKLLPFQKQLLKDLDKRRNIIIKIPHPAEINIILSKFIDNWSKFSIEKEEKDGNK